MTFCPAGSQGAGTQGSFPWAAGAVGLFSARQTALNAIRVDFSYPLRVLDPAGAHDALNPALWSLESIEPFGVTPRLVQSVERIDNMAVTLLLDGNLADGQQWQLNAGPIYRLTADVAIECDEVPFLTTIGAPRATGRERTLVDIANPQLIQDAAVIDPPPVGTYQLTDTGDYAQDGALQGLRKRIFRRVMTVLGGFYHLPDYGLAQGIKKNLTEARLDQLRTKAVGQIRREPEVLEASITIERTAVGVVTWIIRARTVRGEIEPITLPIPSAG